MKNSSNHAPQEGQNSNLILIQEITQTQTQNQMLQPCILGLDLTGHLACDIYQNLLPNSLQSYTFVELDYNEIIPSKVLTHHTLY